LFWNLSWIIYYFIMIFKVTYWITFIFVYNLNSYVNAKALWMCSSSGNLSYGCGKKLTWQQTSRSREQWLFGLIVFFLQNNQFVTFRRQRLSWHIYVDSTELYNRNRVSIYWQEDLCYSELNHKIESHNLLCS